ncbi:hypothetical protein D3C85_1796600 [compost metagenome]
MIGIIHAGYLLEQLGNVFFRPLHMFGYPVQSQFGVRIHLLGVLVNLLNNLSVRIFLFMGDVPA